ncbi:hypothetical protein EJ05DRAFT_175800 [Pseudovirgaria hyperparasitica]|uniref:Uncharacterized protein n=1 Tax=Pseudovirgaria hyperparasitica TaxID=470096 RepID=A0A6A6WHH6_9PEZI|nr:uncharacterized protein EJ05DRAFT_175800 [Pseudovirgaria hyperparasitica]KAF2761534.1 hypothetical protein EJ05DRAFT_175800 [Pseudovirgaria hyperparasitica]
MLIPGLKVYCHTRSKDQAGRALDIECSTRSTTLYPSPSISATHAPSKIPIQTPATTPKSPTHKISATAPTRTGNPSPPNRCTTLVLPPLTIGNGKSISDNTPFPTRLT